MFKEDPARAGPGGSNIEEIGGGRGIQRGGQRSLYAEWHMLNLEQKQFKKMSEWSLWYQRIRQ